MLQLHHQLHCSRISRCCSRISRCCRCMISCKNCWIVCACCICVVIPLMSSSIHIPVMSHIHQLDIYQSCLLSIRIDIRQSCLLHDSNDWVSYSCVLVFLCSPILVFLYSCVLVFLYLHDLNDGVSVAERLPEVAEYGHILLPM